MEYYSKKRSNTNIHTSLKCVKIQVYRPTLRLTDQNQTAPHSQNTPQYAKKASRQATDLRIRGANGRTRTGDLRITSALLYQLSHVGIECFP